MSSKPSIHPQHTKKLFDLRKDNFFSQPVLLIFFLLTRILLAFCSRTLILHTRKHNKKNPIIN